MIWIYREDGSHAFSCSDDEMFFRHIMDIENAKLLEGHLQFGHSTWSFTHYSSRRVVDLYTHTPCLLRSSCLIQAFNKSSGLLKIYQGTISRLVEIVATDDVDIDTLKKQWCLNYCKAHHYQIFKGSQPVSLPSSLLEPMNREQERSGFVKASFPSRNYLSSAYCAGQREKIIFRVKGFV